MHSSSPNSALERIARPHSAAPADASEVARLKEMVDELTKERDQLVVVVDLLQELASAKQVSDVLQKIARRLGEIFGLDRSSIYLAGDGAHDVRLVATAEDPSLRNLVVDLRRYPELRQAFESGQTVFIPDATSDPLLATVRASHDLRNFSSIVVVPIRWRDAVIGAIFLRTERGSVPFAGGDIRFCEVIAGLTARALRNASHLEQNGQIDDEKEIRRRRADRERIAFVAFLRRLVNRYATADDQLWAETLLPRDSDEELERLVTVAQHVLREEAK